MPSRSGASVHLPVEVRQAWAVRLSEAGLHDAALAWLSEDAHRADRAYLAILAGRPDLTRALLTPHGGGAEPADLTEFERILLDSAEAMVGGVRALHRLRDLVADLRNGAQGTSQPLQVWRVLAVATCRQDLALAGSLATEVIASAATGLATESVIAAADRAAHDQFDSAAEYLQYALSSGGLSQGEVKTHFKRLLTALPLESDALTATAVVGMMLSDPAHQQFWDLFSRNLFENRWFPAPRSVQFAVGALRTMERRTAKLVRQQAGSITSPTAVLRRRQARRHYEREVARVRAANPVTATHCDCLMVAQWSGPRARTDLQARLLSGHLVTTAVAAPAGRVVHCPSSGAMFVDLPEKEVTVSMPPQFALGAFGLGDPFGENGSAGALASPPHPDALVGLGAPPGQ